MKAGLDDFAGKVAKGFVVRGPCEGHDAAVIGWNRRLIEAHIAKVVTELTMAIDGLILLQEADAVLSDENPTRIEAAFTAFIKCGSEQALAGTDRIGAIGDNNVKRLRRLVNKIDAIVNDQRKTWVVVRASVMIRQILTTERNHASVNFYHGDAFDITVARDFAQHGTIAAADN